ncbi:MAG: glycosyltransferase family protein, partial [Planctomycetota bacterium]
IDLEAPEGAARKALGISPETPLVAIMPGSRRQVRKRLLPIYLEAADSIGAVLPDASFAIGTPDGTLGEVAAEADVPFPAVKQHDLLRDATAGMLNSGTISLEAAILGCPGVIGYRMNWFNYTITKQFVSLPYVGLPNIVLGGPGGELERPAMRELIQRDLKAEAVTAEVLGLLKDSSKREAAKALLAEVREKLGGPGASARAAEAVLGLL